MRTNRIGEAADTERGDFAWVEWSPRCAKALATQGPEDAEEDNPPAECSEDEISCGPGNWGGRGDPDPYYRIVEFKPDEQGNCQSGRNYGDCCSSSDLAHDFVIAKKGFERRRSWRGIRGRRPPRAIFDFVSGQSEWPEMIASHAFLRDHINAENRKIRTQWG